ncbi:MAG: hypoxanthine phosphoribosyltransferase [Acidimicrobiales bacterium]|nr:hypoxanthine phosphoribosyltransferase [Acidimicrobiales bacterium]
MSPVGPGPVLLADPARLDAEVRRLAAEVSSDHPQGVTLLAVLKGSIIFLADLARRVTVPVRVDMVAVAPFDGATLRTRVVKDLDHPIRGEAVVLVTGIVDTGLTVDFLRRHLEPMEPASIRVATLVDKPVRRILPTAPDYAAIDGPDRFLIGYGLDHRGRYRNLRGLWSVEGTALQEDPDRYVAELYGPPD